MTWYEQRRRWREINFYRKLRRRGTKMQKRPTKAEELMWKTLQYVNSKLPEDCYFQRQFVKSPYILDFYCKRAKLCIEVDGATHEDAIDKRRDQFLLESFGIQTIRVKNEDAYEFSYRKEFGAWIINIISCSRRHANEFLV